MLHNILQYLTKKQINNSELLIAQKPAEQSFIEQKNISSIASHMYKSIYRSKPCYFKFKDYIEKCMKNWITMQKIKYNRDFALYDMERLNQNFLDDHQYLLSNLNISFIKTDNEKNYEYNIEPDNVWKDVYEINTFDNNNNLVKKIVKAKDMTVQDYINIDVWKPRNVYADFDFEKFRSFRDQYGYANAKIPRNYDKDPASFGLVHRDPKRASLEDTPRAYDNSGYYEAKGL